LLNDLLTSFEASGKDGVVPRAMSIQPAGNIGDYVRARAEDILREERGPLHINAIHAEFQRRGLHIPGAGRTVNLIVHLRKAPGIVSPGRGVYALEAHAGPLRDRLKITRRKKRSQTRRPPKAEV
jgi:hypothetical protein